MEDKPGLERWLQRVVLQWRSKGLNHDTYLQLIAILLVTPIIILLGLLLVVPFGISLWRSVFDAAGTGFSFASFKWAFESPSLRSAFVRSLTVATFSVALEISIGIPLAILLSQKLPGRGVMRAAVTLPWAIPTIAVATAFLWLADINYGLLNQLGSALGLLDDGPLILFASPKLALPMIIIVHAWKGLPLAFIVILSALQSLPAEHLEAAKVDGAWRLAQFRHIILPHLKSSIALVAVLSGINNFAMFDFTFLLTSGGPAGTTLTLPLLLYNEQYLAFNSGRAAAIGVGIFFSGVLVLGGLFLFEAFDYRRRR